MKAQSATEYLINYSWAILVLAALIAVLLWIGLPNFANSEPERCDFPVGSTGCENLRLDNGAGGALRVKDFLLTNNFNKKIYICGLECSESFSNSPPRPCGGNPAKPSFAPGESKALTTPISCTDNNHQPVTLAVNSLYRGRLYIFYSYDGDTGSEARVSTGAIVARVGQA